MIFIVKRGNRSSSLIVVWISLEVDQKISVFYKRFVDFGLQSAELYDF